MKIIKDYIPLGRKNRPGFFNPCEYITIHNTGNSNVGANAKSHSNYLKSKDAESRPVSWHYTVDDTEIYQHLPDNESAFHAGDGAGSGNRRSIGIEICMNNDGDLRKATDNATELAADLCQKYNIETKNIVQHHNWSGKNCPQMIRQGLPYVWDTFIGKVEQLKLPQNSIGTQAANFSHLSHEESANKILELVKSNAMETGIFPSIKAAQMILESNYLKSELAIKANNCFGMKSMLSGNNWQGSTWNGTSVYAKETMEQKADGTPYAVMADFRKYDNIESSIADHSAYLLGAKIGTSLRYAGLTDAPDYRAQIQIIKDGGYATDINYVGKVIAIIERFRLDRHDGELLAAPDTISMELSNVKVNLFGQKTVEVPGGLHNNRYYLGARALLEAMGFSVDWDGSEILVNRVVLDD